jgi:hypothetical protein
MSLSGLDTIDWPSLTHAYGPARTTANELRALTSEDAAERSRAFDSLTSSICHQGSVYPATAAAVPFLVQAAEIATLPADSRMWTVALLSWVAAGNVNLRRFKPDAIRETWVQTLESSLRAAAPRLLVLARTVDAPAVRAWAVWFVRTLPATTNDIAALRGCLAIEHDAVVRATIALGVPAADPVQRDLISRREDPLVRLCAAAQLIPISTDVDVLTAIAVECLPRCDRFDDLPDKSEDTSAVRLIASRLGSVSRERQVAWILQWLGDPRFAQDALYAATDASADSRSTARRLVEPIASFLLDPPSPELMGTAAFALVELGLPGVDRLREIASSTGGELQQTARQYLGAPDSWAQSAPYLRTLIPVSLAQLRSLVDSDRRVPDMSSVQDDLLVKLCRDEIARLEPDTEA